MQSTIRYIKEELQDHCTPSETAELIKLIFSELRGYSYTDLVLKEGVILDAQERDKVHAILSRLKQSEPIQYILGHTRFHDLDLVVSRAVLIPRPETAELVQWIISEPRSPHGRILDIGTGSGCIALALKKNFPDSFVAGCDISEDALTIARENGKRNQLNVPFFKADIRCWEDFPAWEPVDLIVSNPPYVTGLEKLAMNKNVLDFEPSQALFVTDEDPLIHYRQIMGFSKKWLVPGGWLYFEINENFSPEMADLFESSGFSEVVIRQDLQGKERMVRGKKPACHC